MYTTPQFDAWAGHYSWGCNVFGNKVFYGIGFRVVVCEKYIQQKYDHPNKSTKVEWVSEPRGVFISHVVVTVNKTCLLYTSPSPRDPKTSRMPSSA